MANSIERVKKKENLPQKEKRREREREGGGRRICLIIERKCFNDVDMNVMFDFLRSPWALY